MRVLMANLNWSTFTRWRKIQQMQPDQFLNLSCRQLGSWFKVHGALKTHMQTHTGEKPFVCKHAASYLKTHIWPHSGERSLGCKQCEYSCNSAGILNSRTTLKPIQKKNFHLHTVQILQRTSTDSGEKLFAWNHCNFVSAQARNPTRSNILEKTL